MADSTGKPYPLSWPVEGEGKRPWVCWDDVDKFEIGPDSSGKTFEKIADLMLRGHYYADDVIEFDGSFRGENRNLRVGDQVVQRAPIIPGLAWPRATSRVQIFLAERSENECAIGYVTTIRHHAKGKWSARLRRENERLTLTVSIIACPRSWLFWAGLPYARWLQIRAKRKAVERFRRVAKPPRVD